MEEVIGSIPIRSTNNPQYQRFTGTTRLPPTASRVLKGAEAFSEHPATASRPPSRWPRASAARQPGCRCHDLRRYQPVSVRCREPRLRCIEYKHRTDHAISLRCRGASRRQRTPCNELEHTLLPDRTSRFHAGRDVHRRAEWRTSIRVGRQWRMSTPQGS